MSNRLQAHPLTDGTNLIPRTALLNAMEDEDDIEWKEYRFDRPHRAEPKMPDESLAMIKFAGTPALQDALRALRMEFNRYLHHSGTITSRKSEVDGYRYRSIEVGAFKLQAFSIDTIPLK